MINDSAQHYNLLILVNIETIFLERHRKLEIMPDNKRKEEADASKKVPAKKTKFSRRFCHNKKQKNLSVEENLLLVQRLPIDKLLHVTSLIPARIKAT